MAYGVKTPYKDTKQTTYSAVSKGANYMQVNKCAGIMRGVNIWCIHELVEWEYDKGKITYKNMEAWTDVHFPFWDCDVWKVQESKGVGYQSYQARVTFKCTFCVTTYGCIFTHYPYIRINALSNGGAYYAYSLNSYQK
jgi:hypothetical protein